VFTDIGTEDNALQFSYDIYDRPEGFTEDCVTEEFDQMITGIFLALLEKKMNAKAIAEDNQLPGKE
jgi:hypothetical protein